MWGAMYVQQKIDDMFNGRAQAEYDPKKKVCGPQHGNRKEAQGEEN